MTARYFVVEALMRQAQGGYANLVLDTMLKKHPLEARDRGFATAVFYSVLEHQATLDYILNQFSKKPVAKLDAPIREILRSGLAQARYMQVPASAAVNESVKLAKSFKKTSAAGMVNAILRKAISFDVEGVSFKSDLERICVLGSVSSAVGQFFLDAYPQDALAILTKTAAQNLTAVRVNPLKTTPDALAALLIEQGAKQVEVSRFLPNCLMVAFAGSPADCPAFADGLFHVEGETSQIAALALGANAGDIVIDFCAAPGGKSLAIAQEMQNQGVLYSCDVSPNRVSLIEKALQRGGITCAKAVQNDAVTQNPIARAACAAQTEACTEPQAAHQPQAAAPAAPQAAHQPPTTSNGDAAQTAAPLADRILADVPCSGLGILAKKPDIRYKNLAGMAELTALQTQILENAASCLKTGGRLVYSTCTINPAENQDQIKAFLARHPEFTTAPIAHLPHGMITGEYGALSLSHKTGLDGFFICAMEKHA